MTGVRVIEVASLRPGLSDAVSGAVAGAAIRWREHVEAAGDVEARFLNGDPALITKGRCHYLACWPDDILLSNVVRRLAASAGLDIIDLPEHVRFRTSGHVTFAFNYGPEPWDVPSAVSPVLGERTVRACSLAAWTLPKGATVTSEPGED